METFLPFDNLAQETELLQQELGFVILLTLAALVAIVTRRIRLPYTVALVIVGLGLSFIPNPFGFELSSELILALLVPPLIFEATLNLEWRILRQNLLPILMLALVGTLTGTFIVAGLILMTGRYFIPSLELPFAAAIAFGALISATDPVAVIALFRDLGVSKRLAILVEGESLFNDGIAIVIFNLALGIGVAMAAAEGEVFNLFEAIEEFFRVALGGLGVGIVLGFVVSYVILKNVDDHLIETATTVTLAFGSFVIAEEFHVSGVLSVVAAGIFVGNVGMSNTTPTTKIALVNFWEFLAFVVNSMVFLLIGLQADLFEFQLNITLLAAALLIVLLSRSIVVYVISWVHSKVDARRLIPREARHVIFWGGLRGAISLALALSLTGAIFGDDVAEVVQLMTFSVVLFTLLVQGTTIAGLLGRLGLTARSEHEHQQRRQQALLYASRTGREELDRLYKQGILTAEVWEAMSDVYEDEVKRRDQQLRSLLRDYPELEQTMILQARRDLLRAERSAYSDALRRGLISEEIYHELIRETDNQIAALGLIAQAMDSVRYSDE